MSLINLKKELEEVANPEKAIILSRFFKTKKGEYGEGDNFLGITVPNQRSVAQRHLKLSFDDIQKLLQSKIHEYRLTTLLILVKKFKKANSDTKKNVYNFYLKNTKYINNWDLVDLSAHYIVGKFLLDKDRAILYKLAKSENLWEKRISIISTWIFIRNFEFEDTLKISKILLNDKHDLIHKATGWMLREVGKKNQPLLENFLKIHYKKMPRTMLRYAIEKFEENLRKAYLKNKI